MIPRPSACSCILASVLAVIGGVAVLLSVNKAGLVLRWHDHSQIYCLGI